MGGTATLSLREGSTRAFEGELVEVMELSGSRVAVRDSAGRYRSVTLSRLIVGALPERDTGPIADDETGVVLSSLSDDERDALMRRAGHVREVLTGYQSGSRQFAQPGEPRPQYASDASLEARYAAKASELGVSVRTLERWAASYRQLGEAGLVDERRVYGRGSTIDPRWEQACREILSARIGASTPTYSAILLKAEMELEDVYGKGVVALPSRATAYRRLKEMTKGTNALTGSAKGRRSIADRPKGVFGRLRPTMPGEYVILDTQTLDMFAMEPVTLRWVPVQLTVAQDLFSRCILGLRVTPISTRAVDVAGVLYRTVTPTLAPPEWPDEVCWPYHGVPQNLVFTEESELFDPDVRLAPLPPCPPAAIVVDRGKQYLSAHVIGVCANLGISIQPAQPRKPTDKPTVERFFKTLREDLIQHLPAYKGPDVHSRGERVEDAAFLYVNEVEEVIKEWIAFVYHRNKHDGLCAPAWPGLDLSPNQMYEIGVATAGLLRLPASAGLRYDFMETSWHEIQHYGIDLDTRRYNGDGLDRYRFATSPYGGAHAGKWPVRSWEEDINVAYFRDPYDGTWHELEWEHAKLLGCAFSREAAAYVRRNATRLSGRADTTQAMKDLLRRWDNDMIADRRERRMALRIAQERAALPGSADTPAEQVAALPSIAALRFGQIPDTPAALAPLRGDDDESEEIYDQAPDGDFYADAFDVVDE
jgi:putative transposase